MSQHPLVWEMTLSGSETLKTPQTVRNRPDFISRCVVAESLNILWRRVCLDFSIKFYKKQAWSSSAAIFSSILFWSCAEISLSLSRLSVWDSISRPPPSECWPVSLVRWEHQRAGQSKLRSWPWWQSGLCWRYLLSPLDPGKYNNCCSVTQK